MEHTSIISQRELPLLCLYINQFKMRILLPAFKSLSFIYVPEIMVPEI